MNQLLLPTRIKRSDFNIIVSRINKESQKKVFLKSYLEKDNIFFLQNFVSQEEKSVLLTVLIKTGYFIYLYKTKLNDLFKIVYENEEIKKFKDDRVKKFSLNQNQIYRDDIGKIADVGLYRACKEYDFYKGSSFTSFLYQKIFNELRDELTTIGVVNYKYGKIPKKINRHEFEILVKNQNDEEIKNTLLINYEKRAETYFLNNDIDKINKQELISFFRNKKIQEKYNKITIQLNKEFYEKSGLNPINDTLEINKERIANDFRSHPEKAIMHKTNFYETIMLPIINTIYQLDKEKRKKISLYLNRYTILGESKRQLMSELNITNHQINAFLEKIQEKLPDFTLFRLQRVLDTIEIYKEIFIKEIKQFLEE